MTTRRTTAMLPDGTPKTIPDAMKWVYKSAELHGTDTFLLDCDSPHVTFLAKKLHVSKVQVVLLSIMVEYEDAMTWGDFAKFFQCMRLDVMKYAYEMDDLEKKGWVRSILCDYSCTKYDLMDSVADDLARNKAFKPEKLDGLELPVFLKKLYTRTWDVYVSHGLADRYKLETSLGNLVSLNQHLPICEEVSKFQAFPLEMIVFLLCVVDYANTADQPKEGIDIDFLDGRFPGDTEMEQLEESLMEGSCFLIEDGLIEHKCINGLADVRKLVLTRKTKEELLGGFVPRKPRSRWSLDEMTYVAQIAPKDLFYNAEDKKQICELTELLGQEKMTEIQTRLAETGMRKGFACLFYGAPGTGKTETAFQLARQTGRDIMVVDIAGMRDKYVGESENNIKAVFERYRSICNISRVTPILFFNEADGIFGKRTEIGGANSSVQKMDNAMQNIILQEMEHLDGILIATTNLTCNLDNAFERRFIYKVKFHKPDVETKTKIWQSMVKDLSQDDAHTLASGYDFSGGQIENVARRQTINYVLSGKRCDIDDLRQLCSQESIGMNSDNNHATIAGFSR